MGPSSDGTERSRTLNNRQRLGGLLFLALSIGYGIVAREIELDFFSETELFNARTLPIMLAMAGVVISIALILTARDEEAAIPIRSLNWRPAITLLAALWAFGLLLEGLGFIIATSIFLSIGFIVMGERRWLRIVATAVPVALGFWVVMSLLDIQLPSSEWLIAVTSND